MLRPEAAPFYEEDAMLGMKAGEAFWKHLQTDFKCLQSCVEAKMNKITSDEKGEAAIFLIANNCLCARETDYIMHTGRVGKTDLLSIRDRFGTFPMPGRATSILVRPIQSLLASGQPKGRRRLDTFHPQCDCVGMSPGMRNHGLRWFKIRQNGHVGDSNLSNGDMYQLYPHCSRNNWTLWDSVQAFLLALEAITASLAEVSFWTKQPLDESGSTGPPSDCWLLLCFILAGPWSSLPTFRDWRST